MSTLPFGPYELLRRLGSGGMAETFLAVRRGPGGFEQHVCVKRILPSLESDPELVALFMEEARLAAQLRHANITQVVDFGVVAGSHYLALELVDGLDLRALLRALREHGRRLDPPLAVLIAIQLCAALELAHTPERHRPGVVHRDVSPSNVLVSRAGEVYLTDFGIARALGSKRRTDSGVIRGKVPYMAAEYALEARFDARSDLFSLGVLLFEALAGQRPFDGVTELDTLSRIKEGRHPSLAALCPAAHPSLVAIVEQLLVPRPEERFQSAAALHEALAHVAPPPTAARQLGELVRSVAASSPGHPELTQPSRTAALADAPPPSAYPQVVPAPADAVTRTSDAPGSSKAWAATDPTQISHHDRPSPYAPSAVVVGSPASPVPATRVHLPNAHPALSPVAPAVPKSPTSSAPPVPKRRTGLWAAALIGGLLVFALAGGGAYFLVVMLRQGTP
jgi:serine/threonine protein kinase